MEVYLSATMLTNLTITVGDSGFIKIMACCIDYFRLTARRIHQYTFQYRLQSLASNSDTPAQKHNRRSHRSIMAESDVPAQLHSIDLTTG